MIVGGGHNGLVAATYLAQADLSVLVLERLDTTGGAAVSAKPVRRPAGAAVALLLPRQRDARPDRLRPRPRPRPALAHGGVVHPGATATAPHSGLFVERNEGTATAESFRAAHRLRPRVRRLADVLRRGAGVHRGARPHAARAAAHRAARPATWSTRRTWDYLVEEPLGQVIEERFADDTVRGVVATDALIGTFADMNDESLVQNRCFLYHLIGNGSGEWRVPVGGMGAVTDALAVAARNAGATIVTGAGVSGIESDGTEATVTWHDGETWRTASCDWVLSNVAPWVLQLLLGEDAGRAARGLPAQGQPAARPAAAAAVRRDAEERVRRHVPRRRGLQPAAAGLHRGRGAATCRRPQPGELYCHSLTDPSILGPLAAQGMHTLTYFGVHTPGPGVRRRRRRAQRDVAVERALDAINEVPRGADRVADRHRRARQPLPGGQGAAGHRRGAGDARRPHLPRRPGLALGARTGRASTPPPSGGAWPPTCPTCCSAAPARGAGVRSAASAVTTRHRPCWTRCRDR